LLFAVLATGLGLFVGARSTRPVTRLAALVARYRQRDFAARADVRTGDELESLGDALTSMATELSAGEKELARRAVVEANLARYVPRDLARSIVDGATTVALGGERREVTVLFADVVGFTPFAESTSPERAVAFLNQLFSVLTEVVFRHEGTVDKFIGDCIMAIFGAPTAQVDHAASALAAAEDMQRFVEANAPAWEAEFGFQVRLGIGVATGEALLGNLGSETRMEYTAIGDAVNVAARLESAAKGGQILITARTAAAAGTRFSYSSLGPHILRGKTQPVETLELHLRSVKDAFWA
jgi:class 3 adenylate cyclase